MDDDDDGKGGGGGGGETTARRRVLTVRIPIEHHHHEEAKNTRRGRGGEKILFETMDKVFASVLETSEIRARDVKATRDAREEGERERKTYRYRAPAPRFPFVPKSIGALSETGTCEVTEVVVYDFKRKYSAGATEYRYPAVLQLEIENELKRKAELVFEHCGCRDFGRVDFIVCEDGHSHFLEINTLPGLTSTSLLPKSASCSGYDFQSLAKRLVEPAVARFTRPVGNLLET